MKTCRLGGMCTGFCHEFFLHMFQLTMRSIELFKKYQKVSHGYSESTIYGMLTNSDGPFRLSPDQFHSRCHEILFTA